MMNFLGSARLSCLLWYIPLVLQGVPLNMACGGRLIYSLDMV
jgi:hypothetical protein